jgi:predicted DCC family thiol-disulfide oxidoreductase YuxK
VTSTISYPLVVFYDAASRECAAKVEPLLHRDTAGRLQFVESRTPGIHARDAAGRCWTGIVALEAAYRAAWDGEVSL